MVETDPIQKNQDLLLMQMSKHTWKHFVQTRCLQILLFRLILKWLVSSAHSPHTEDTRCQECNKSTGSVSINPAFSLQTKPNTLCTLPCLRSSVCFPVEWGKFYKFPPVMTLPVLSSLQVHTPALVASLFSRFTHFQNLFWTILVFYHSYHILPSGSRVKMPLTRGSAALPVLPLPLFCTQKLPAARGLPLSTTTETSRSFDFLAPGLRDEKYVKGSLSKALSHLLQTGSR